MPSAQARSTRRGCGASSKDAGESLDALSARQPMGRLGTPEEVADAVLYLTTAEFATGTILTVDGGLTAA